MAAQEQNADFDALTPVETADDDDDDVEWLDMESGDTVIGEVREVVENAGQYDNRAYKLSRGVGDTVMFWGSTSANMQFDRADLGPGDVVGFKNTGQKYSTDHENDGVKWEVRTQ